MCTDGDDSGSEVELGALLQMLRDGHIHLMIIGIAIDEQSTSTRNMRRLCKATSKGIFIKTPEDLQGIQLAYELISSKLATRQYHQPLIYEPIN